MPLAREGGGIPRRQKLQGRFLGLKDFHQALPLRLAKGPILHPIHQGIRFSWTGSDLFEALDELLYHDGRDPFCRHDSG